MNNTHDVNTVAYATLFRIVEPTNRRIAGCGTNGAPNRRLGTRFFLSSRDLLRLEIRGRGPTKDLKIGTYRNWRVSIPPLFRDAKTPLLAVVVPN